MGLFGKWGSGPEVGSRAYEEAQKAKDLGDPFAPPAPSEGGGSDIAAFRPDSDSSDPSTTTHRDPDVPSEEDFRRFSQPGYNRPPSETGTPTPAERPAESDFTPFGATPATGSDTVSPVPVEGVPMVRLGALDEEPSGDGTPPAPAASETSPSSDAPASAPAPDPAPPAAPAAPSPAPEPAPQPTPEPQPAPQESPEPIPTPQPAPAPVPDPPPTPKPSKKCSYPVGYKQFYEVRKNVGDEPTLEDPDDYIVKLRDSLKGVTGLSVRELVDIQTRKGLLEAHFYRVDSEGNRLGRVPDDLEKALSGDLESQRAAIDKKIKQERDKKRQAEQAKKAEQDAKADQIKAALQTLQGIDPEQLKKLLDGQATPPQP